MELKKLSPAKRDVMNYFWSTTEERSKQDLLKYFSNKNWNGNTIAFYLSTLTEEGYLKYRRDGKVFYYTPCISRLEYEQTMVVQKLKKTYGTSLEYLLAAFCGKQKLTKQNEIEIQTWLEKLKENLSDD